MTFSTSILGAMLLSYEMSTFWGEVIVSLQAIFSNFWLNGDQSLWCHAGPYHFLWPCSHSTPYLSPAVTLVLYFSHALAWCIIASSRPEQAQVPSKTLPQEISLLEGWSAVVEVFANWKTINDLRRCAWQSRSNWFLLSQDFVLTSFRFRAW